MMAGCGAGQCARARLRRVCTSAHIAIATSRAAQYGFKSVNIPVEDIISAQPDELHAPDPDPADAECIWAAWWRRTPYGRPARSWAETDGRRRNAPLPPPPSRDFSRAARVRAARSLARAATRPT